VGGVTAATAAIVHCTCFTCLQAKFEYKYWHIHILPESPPKAQPHGAEQGSELGR
jgi:hypothetical protein